jgi:hypothetical protein
MTASRPYLTYPNRAGVPDPLAGGPLSKGHEIPPVHPAASKSASRSVLRDTANRINSCFIRNIGSCLASDREAYASEGASAQPASVEVLNRSCRERPPAGSWALPTRTHQRRGWLIWRRSVAQPG